MASFASIQGGEVLLSVHMSQCLEETLTAP
jgi:hypothetical protein